MLADDSFKYGEAIWYYALAHKSRKVKDVLDLLISFSLIHSTAFPARPDMDAHLGRLVSSPKAALTEISRVDGEAAEILSTLLSGYATVRKFYDLRDEEVNSAVGERLKPRTIGRKADAAAALVAVVNSADASIRGGLYDDSRDAVISVDFLLALLGEAMVFVNQTRPNFTVTQMHVLLRAIEDLQTVTARVYSACTEFLETVIASAQGLKGSTPADMLRKSTTSTSGSFSLVGSSMFASQLQRSIGSSGVLVKGDIKRGWDWRRGLAAGTTGEDVLRILRLGLAKDLARAWIAEVDGGI